MKASHQVRTALKRLRKPVRNPMWMNSQASQPAKPDSRTGPGRHHGAAAGDIGGRAEVAVPEGPGGQLAGQLAADPAAGVVTALHGNLGNARQLAQAHHVADDRDLRMAGNCQVVLHHDPAGPVLLGPGGPGDGRGERRGLDAGGPQHGADAVPDLVAIAVSDRQAVEVDVGHE